MDSVTHLVAGALTPMAFRNAPRTRMMILFGILCGELPDIDVIAGKSPEAILAFHRGATHALVAQPLWAVLMAIIFHRLIKKGDASGSWSFADTWLVALTALLIHLFLDCMTTFGTQILLPFSDLRVAFPAMYIIDLSLTLPLIAALFLVFRRVRGSGAAPGTLPPRPAAGAAVARGALAWLVSYPLLALCLNFGLTSSLAKEYANLGNPLGIESVELSPEPFAPLNWKVVATAPGKYYMGRYFLPALGREIGFTAYERPNALFGKAKEEIPLLRIYDKFTTYAFETVKKDGDDDVHTFADVRYEATMPGLMNALGRSDGLFLMQLKTHGGVLSAYRFLYRGRDAHSTPWQPVAEKTARAG